MNEIIEPKKRHGKHKHPLRWMLLTHGIPATPREEDEFLNVLQDRGLVSDLCVRLREIAPADVARVVALHDARWTVRA